MVKKVDDSTETAVYEYELDDRGVTQVHSLACESCVASDDFAADSVIDNILSQVDPLAI